jgi:hypothetical protein
MWAQCPDYPRKRTSTRHHGKSHECHNPTYAVQKIVPLFDHLVGAGEQHRRDFEAKCLGGLLGLDLLLLLHGM